MNTPPAASAVFDCPGCSSTLTSGSETCGACGVSLTSETARALWAIEQELASVVARRKELLDEAIRLRARLASGAGPTARPHESTEQDLRPAAVLTPDSGLGGQQLLLGLGAFLLLSGASFFLWMVWDLIGVAGQALVMVALTAAAAGSARWATRRRMPAAAETAALIAAGLLALDVTAAHRLGLAGLDRVDGHLYFGIAGVLAALTVIGFDRLVPARDAAGIELRPIVVYRPLAAFAASASAWHLLGALDDSASTVLWSAALLATALLGAGVMAFAHLFDHRGARDAGGTKASVVAAGLPAVLALTGYIATAAYAGYGPEQASGDRLLAAALLLAVPAACVAAAALRPESRVIFAVLASAGSATVVGIPLWLAERPALAVVSVLVGAALVTTAHPRIAAKLDEWRGPLTAWSLSVALGVLWLVLLALDAAEENTMVDYVNGAGAGGSSAWWVACVPLVGLLAHRSWNAARNPGAWAQVALHSVVFATISTALRDASVETRFAATLIAATASLLGATFVAWRTPIRRTWADAAGVEKVNLIAGSAFAVMALVQAVRVGDGVVALTCTALVLAAAYTAHASRPGRLSLGFVTVLLVSIANWINVDDALGSAIEAYTLVPAAGLLVMGILLRRTGQVTSSLGLMGPALAVGLGPSALAALFGGDLGRTVIVTVVALALLLGGYRAKWKAPVGAGALVLAGVGVTQGGALIAWLPGWVLLVSAGALLLTVGVTWERNLVRGRASAVWFRELW